jgi:ubiquinone/menaquinone biosynthesis C-methylase UbiE
MNTENELSRIAKTYGSEKIPLYENFYFELLKNRRDKITKVIEVGIGNGSSLLTWREFFPQAKIYGVDNRGKLLLRKITRGCLPTINIM